MEEHKKYASPAEEPSAISIEEMDAFFNSILKGKFTLPDILTASKGRCTMRLACTEAHLRPGGFISGPTQMGLADHAAYVAVFTHAGITPMALTSNLNINFLRPCIGDAVIAEATLLKLGRTLAVISVDIRAEGSEKLSSQAVVNYSLPQEAGS